VKNKKLFNIISTLILAGVLVLSSCSSSPVNYDSLEKTIAEAKDEYNITDYSANGTNVQLGMYWVTVSEKAEFLTAIETAEAALKSNSQIIVDNATRILANKIEEFKNARQSGTAAPLDKTGLSAKIAEAEMEKLFVVVASYQEEVAQYRYWVSQNEMGVLDSAVSAAKTSLNEVTTQTALDSAANILGQAITSFKVLRKDGTKVSNFTQIELNDLIRAAKAIEDNIKPSNNGEDAGPAEYWVNQTYYSDYKSTIESAITTASNPTGNIDNVYTNLVSAINTINTYKQLGPTVDKNSLFEIIRSADTAKTGVVVAANAEQAPLGYKWATKAQWLPFNAAYNDALDAARDPNTAKKNVTDKTSALISAINTFNSAVNKNGPGTKPYTVTIDGLPYNYSGCQIEIYLYANPDILSGEYQYYGAGTVQNNAAGEIRLTPRSGSTSTGNGTWYVVFVVNKEPVQYYISKSTVYFSAFSNVLTSFNYYKKYVFKYRYGDIAAKKGVPSSGITLDELYQLMEGMAYSQMLGWGLLPGQLYKNETLTLAFSGSDMLNANIDIYCEYPLMDSLGTVSNKYIIPLTANTWKNGNINNYGNIDLYSINVTVGNTYYLWWNDKKEGDGSKTLDIDVYAYNGSNNLISLTVYGMAENDSAWYEPVSFTASSSGKVYIKVRSFNGGRYTGTYAIMYNTSGEKP